MTFLDDQLNIKRYDRYQMLRTISDFYLQVKQAWSEIKKIELPKAYHQVNKIVISGMGGSALAGHIIKELYKDKLGIPLEIINSYEVPKYLDEKTLFIASSYSGTTEETIISTRQALKRKAKIVGITTGSQLASLLKKSNRPIYFFDPKFNYCRQPRLGLAYSLVAHLGVLRILGLLKITERDMERVINLLRSLNKRWGPAIKQKDNLVKQMADRFWQRIPIVIASQFLVGSTHALANHINENGKNFSVYFAIPELNHHLLEGLTYPKFLKQQLCFLTIESDFYPRRLLARYRVTQAVLVKRGLKFIRYKASGGDHLSQVFEVMTLGSYLSAYLAILNKIDPTPTPWVDLLKKELAKY